MVYNREQLLSYLATCTNVGIFGGTFDPVHNGHMSALDAVASTLPLDAIVLMPASLPSFKQTQKLADANERLHMCELALQEYEFHAPRCPVLLSSFELEREGVSYTVDTLSEIAHELPHLCLYFILGVDAALMLDKWNASETLAQLARFVVVDRPGCVMTEHEEMRLQVAGFSIERVRATTPDVSSSYIRAQLKEGFIPAELLASSVSHYIERKQLYTEK